jgi:energy-coupling factor transport system substrate-specific component
VVRKRCAANNTDFVAAVVSALLGTPWGLSVVVKGIVEGSAPELVIAFALYRSWRLPTALVAGEAAGLAAALLDLGFYYADWPGRWQLTYGSLLTVSAAVIAGLGSWLLVRALARTGVLAPFGSGRDQARV